MRGRDNPLRRLEARYDHVEAGGPAAYRLRDENLNEPFLARVMRPILERGGSSLSKKQRQDYQSMLAQAGYPGGVTVRQLGGIRWLLAIGFSLAAGLFAFALYSIPMLKKVMEWWMPVAIAVMAFAVGFMALPFILRFLINKRKKAVQKTLPDVLDLITIAVEAGLGFDAAMDRVGQRYVGAMGEELVRTTGEIRMGRPWNEAMRGLGERTGVDDVQSIVTGLIQAKDLGVNLGNVLRAQSMRLREERARRAREQAQKAPTKMMIPLILFIFPTLFIVLMGPAALRAIQTLKESDLPGFGGGGGGG